MSASSELERIVKLDRIPAGPIEIEADEKERAALARRFALPVIHALEATLALEGGGEVFTAKGTLSARFEQLCSVAREPFANTVGEALAIRFVPAGAPPPEDEEIEFDSDAPDEIEYEGQSFDLGEAVAQSFGLALNPYATGPDADIARQEGGIVGEDTPSGPFAALAALKQQSD